MSVKEGMPRPKLLTMGLFGVLLVVSCIVTRPFYTDMLGNNLMEDALAGGLFASIIWPIVTRFVRSMFRQY